MTFDPAPDQHFTPLDESDDPELERFRLRAADDMARVFRDMAKGAELATVYVTGKDFFLTTILGVDAAARRVFLDCGTLQGLNQLALEASQILLVGRHYQVRIQCHLTGITKVQLKDGPAFAAPFPASILRIQRREFYRLATPNTSRPTCRVALPDGTRLSAAIVDISLGGIGIIETGTEHESAWQPGVVLKNVVVNLPDDTHIESDIEIRNRYTVAGPSGQLHVHVGCRFLNLDPRMNADIQRYIHRVDLERRRQER